METKSLYYHKTDGGAEYLTDSYTICPSGHKEGIFEGANYIIRIDGDIRQDAELIAAPEMAAEHDRLREVSAELLAACKEFVEYAENGKHPKWKAYLETIAGSKMLTAIAKSEGSQQ